MCAVCATVFLYYVVFAYTRSLLMLKLIIQYKLMLVLEEMCD